MGSLRCPKCGTAYVGGVSECSECHVPLATRRRHPERRSGRSPRKDAERVLEPVTVLETDDIVVVAMAKAVLTSAQIAFIVRGEGIQDLFGVGRFPAGVNLVTGPAQIQVARGDMVEARRLLSDLCDAGGQGL